MSLCLRGFLFTGLSCLALGNRGTRGKGAAFGSSAVPVNDAKSSTFRAFLRGHRGFVNVLYGQTSLNMYNVFAAHAVLRAASVSWVFFRQGVFSRAAEGDLSAAALLLGLRPYAHADGLERAKVSLQTFCDRCSSVE